MISEADIMINVENNSVMDVSSAELEIVHLTTLGNNLYDQGKYDDAQVTFERCLRLCRQVPDDIGEMCCLSNLGRNAEKLGDNQQAIVYFQLALDGWIRMGYQIRIANATLNLGIPVLNQGDLAKASILIKEARVLYRRLKDEVGIGRTYHNEGRLELRRDRKAKAKTLFRKAFEIFSREEEYYDFHETLLELALLMSIPDLPKGISLLGFAEQFRIERGMSDPPLNKNGMDPDLVALRGKVLSSDYERWWECGRAMTLETAIGLTLKGA